MAYDEYLEERIDRVFHEKKANFLKKKMMGGLCYLVDDKMCVGIVHNQLMARIHPDLYESSLLKTGVKKMNFTGRPMKGYIFIDPEGYDLDVDLDYWVQLCLDFNPLAKSSKKKNK